MGYMQAYRVGGGTNPDSAIRKISLLLTGEGIDCDELGDDRPIKFTLRNFCGANI